MTNYKPQERQDLEELYRKQNLRICELEQENKKLKEEVKDLVERNIELDKKYMLVLTENKKLKETIKDHQLYEEKLEHRIIEFEELLHWE